MVSRGATRVVVGLMCLALVTAACSKSEPGGEQLDHIRLQSQFLPEAAAGAYLLGIDQGIFAKHGIELELLPGQGSGFALLQLNENQVQFAQSTLLSFLADRAANASSTTAVMVMADDPRLGILTNFPADSLDDLVGHRVAVLPFTATRQLLPIVLALNGMDPGAILMEPMQTSPALLLEGQVDAMEAATAGDVEVARAAAASLGIDLSFLPLSDFGLVGYYQTIVVRDDLIESNPDLVRRFLAALRESVDRALAAPEADIVSLVTEYVPGIDRAVALAQWQAYKPMLSRSGAFDLSVVETNLGYVRDALEIPHDLRAEETFTNELLP